MGKEEGINVQCKNPTSTFDTNVLVKAHLACMYIHICTYIDRNKCESFGVMREISRTRDLLLIEENFNFPFLGLSTVLFN